MRHTKVLKTVGAIVLFAIVLEAVGIASGLGAFQPYRVARKPSELMRAAAIGDVGAVQRLLAQGADIDERRGYSWRLGLFVVHGPETPVYGETALLFAIRGRNHEVVRTLLDKGADVSVKDSRGVDLWGYALDNLRNGGSQVLVLLSQRVPPPPTIGDSILYMIDDEALLDFALGFPTSALAREISLCNVARFGDILMLDRLLQTMPAAPAKSVSCAMKSSGNLGRPAVEYLLAHGADPNGTADQLAPPLLALLQLMPGMPDSANLPDPVREMFDVLLSRGADPHLTRPARTIGNIGYPATESPIEFARMKHYESAAVFLESWQPTGHRAGRPSSCPLICIKSDQIQGCTGGCATPASDSQGGALGAGYLLRGFGPQGQMGADGRFKITLHQSPDARPVECSFVIEGAVVGSRIQDCGKAFGPVRVTVMPQ